MIVPPDVNRKKFSTFVFTPWPWSISPMLRYWISVFVPRTPPLQYLHHVHVQSTCSQAAPLNTNIPPLPISNSCLKTTAVISSPSSITTKKIVDWQTWYTDCVTSILASKNVFVKNTFLIIVREWRTYELRIQVFWDVTHCHRVNDTSCFEVCSAFTFRV